MSPARRNLLLGVLAAVVLIGGGGWGWYLYLRPSRQQHLDINKVGGVVLIYEVDEARAPADADKQMEALAAAVQRRLDRLNMYSITVRPIEKRRVEIAIPRGKRGHEGLVAQCKDLLAETGQLEFRMLANDRDDGVALDRARDFFKLAALPWQQLLDAVSERWPLVKKAPNALLNVPFDDTAALAAIVAATYPQVRPEEAAEFIRTTYRPAPQTLELRARARAGQPPPEPLPHKGQHFIVLVEGGRAVFYRWTLLSKPEVEMHSRRPEEAPPLEEAHREDLHRGRVFLSVGFPSHEFPQLLYGRKRLNPPPAPGESGVEFFVLTRLPEEGRAVTGADLKDVQDSSDAAGAPAVTFTLTKQGGDFFHEMTSQNQPVADGRRRHLAIILDNVVMQRPTLQSPIRESCMITGKFTNTEISNFVAILRSGALPLPLKPMPVKEITVEPGPALIAGEDHSGKAVADLHSANP